MKAITVTQLNNQIKSILDAHFEVVYVEGEVSRVVYHNSGHLYFIIKDENSSISCAMWRSNLSKMKFKIKEGDKITVFGAINVYMPRGEYKLIAQSITPSGLGELQKAFEELKEELGKLGYFDSRHKKPLPKFPKRIAIVTSKTAAALQDMLRVADKRWHLSELYLFNALVQGENAAEDIARKIKIADEYRFEDNKGFDLIIIGRGGGSREDLWAFNEKVVADAVFRAKTPVISAVGHEIDYLISDFVADKRAATPSNAMELALPDKNEILFNIDNMMDGFAYKMRQILNKKEKNLSHLKELFDSNSPIKKLDMKLAEIQNINRNFIMLSEGVIRKKEDELMNLKKSFFLSSPIRKIEEYQKEVEFIKNSLQNRMGDVLRKKENGVINLTKSFVLTSPIKKIEEYQKEIEFIKNSLQNKINEILYFKQKELNSLKDAFIQLNPKNRQKAGFAQVRKGNKKISLEEIKPNDEFFIETATTSILSKALKKTDISES